jgi:hypothetical protein
MVWWYGREDRIRLLSDLDFLVFQIHITFSIRAAFSIRADFNVRIMRTIVMRASLIPRSMERLRSELTIIHSQSYIHSKSIVRKRVTVDIHHQIFSIISIMRSTDGTMGDGLPRFYSRFTREFPKGRLCIYGCFIIKRSLIIILSHGTWVMDFVLS